MRVILFLALCVLAVSSCTKRISDNCADSTSLRDEAPFPVGTTFDPVHLGAPAPANLAPNFDRLTTENIFKWDYIFPRQNIYRDTFILRDISAFTRNNNMQYHLHPIVWHKQLPQWILDQNTETIFQQLTARIAGKLKDNYSDNLSGIDVVNEAVLDDGTWRVTPWFKAMGPDYVYRAFKTFSDLDTSIKLFYNDYNLALNPTKLDMVLDLCDELRLRGARVDGIGLQMHINIYEPIAPDLHQVFEKIWTRGYLIHLSEVDVSINPLDNLEVIPEDIYQEQAYKYKELVRIYNEIPRAYQYGITTWGFSDKDSWIPQEFSRRDAPLLFDIDFKPKPAFCGFIQGLK